MIIRMMMTMNNQVALAFISFLAAFAIIQTQLAYFTAALAAIIFAYGVVTFLQSENSKRPGAPGPNPWPILGSLPLMHGFRIPYAAFSKLTREYGNIFSMKLGSSWCVVVNDPKSVKEVLITKGAHFDGRPTLRRLDYLFGGDKENSLAFANNSEVQKRRKNILQKFTFPHSHSDLGNTLDRLCIEECQHLIQYLNKGIEKANNNGLRVDMKPLVAKACANIFNRYFCSVQRCDYNDDMFDDYCKNFDKVFWEINNGRAVDFLPWLMPFFQFSESMNVMKSASMKVRHYVEENIIEKKRKNSNSGSRKDFLDAIMVYIDNNLDSNSDSNSDSVPLSSQSALYALEDILGGSCAVANIILRILFDMALTPNASVQGQIKDQIEGLRNPIDASISIEDKQQLPLVVAAMHETIRMTCSPIVPHQATQDSEIGGFSVPKDTVIFVNNHQLNMSPELWDEPETYNPQRFLDSNSGDFTKPAHFQPFSMGKRACIGYKMVYNVAFSIVSNLMSHFKLSEALTSPDSIPLGMLALKPEPFEFILKSNNSIKTTEIKTRTTTPRCRNVA